MSRIAALLALVGSCLCVGLNAAPLDPMAYTPTGTMVPALAVTVDTSATPPTMTGGVVVNGVVTGNAAVFCFTNVDIAAGVVVTVTGTRTLAILSQGTFNLAGSITSNAALTVAGCGGANGAAVPGPGFGPGFGSGDSSGAGGGGFGGIGGLSGLNTPGGVAYGALTTLVQGGSGGGQSTWASSGLTGTGGGGGGGIELGAAGAMTIAATGVVACNGAAGENQFSDGGGGGSGGGILIHGPSGTMLGTLNANGGNGGTSGGEGGGGGGAGGRIHTINIGTAGTRTVTGGAGGTGPIGNGTAGAPGTSTDSVVGPQLSASVPSLALGTVTEGTAGAIFNYTVSGTSTTAATVVTAPANVEVSLNQTVWAASVNIPTTGAWGPTTVYARIAATAAPGPVSGNITHVSTTASANVGVSGTVNPGAHLTVARTGPAAPVMVDNDAQGAGDAGVVILDFTLATVTTAWTVDSLTFTETGTIDGLNALNYLALFVDTNANGTFDPGTDVLATGAAGTGFDAANGTYTAVLTSTAMPASTTRRHFLVAKLAATATAGQTLSVDISAVTASSGGTGNVQGVPVVAANASLEINPARITATFNGPGAFVTVNSNSQGPGGNGLLLLDVTLTSTNDTWTVSDITFGASGTADEQGGINVLSLHEDDGSGFFEGPGVDGLATASAGTSFNGTDGTYTATLLSSAFGMNQSRRFFLVAVLSGVSTTGETFQAALTSLNHNSPTGGTTAGIPTAASSALVIDSPVLTVSAGPANPANRSVLGGAASTQLLAAIQLSASNDAFTVTGTTLTLTGNANWSANVSLVRVYRDTGNGTYEPGDTQIFSGLAVTTTLNCVFSPAVVVTPGTAQDLWVVVELASSAGGSPAETFACQVAAPADVASSTTGSVLFGSTAPTSNTLRVVAFAVTAVTPVQDKLAGGASITINGTGFAAPVTLTIGGVPCTGAATVDAGGTEITGLIIPAGTGTDLPMVLTTNNLPPQTLTQTFTYRNPPPPKAGDSGTGCAAGAGVSALALVALAPALLRRRRRK